MNYVFLGKLSGLLLCGGGFGATSWFFWPEPQTIPEYLYLYTKSETLNSDSSDVVLNTTIDKNFECKIQNKNIDCDILEPESKISHTYKKTSVIQTPRFKTNPENLNKEELKTANNVYVLKINKKHENIITNLSSSDAIEVVSTKEKDKKYATLKLNVVLNEEGIIVPNNNNANNTENPAITIIQNQLNQTSLSSTKETQLQMMDIIADSNKMTIANKVFKDCDKEPKTFGCSNVEKSLNMLVTKFKNKPDGTPNNLMQVLVDRPEKEISTFLSIVDTTETIKQALTPTNVLNKIFTFFKT